MKYNLLCSCGGLGIKVSEVQGCRGRGRPKKTWEQSVKCDIRKYGMQRVELFDKEELLWVEPSNPCKHGKKDV